MIYALPIAQDMRADAVRAALAHLSATEIALVLPAGVPCALADPAELTRLQQACDELGKRVVVVGGDPALRALAVAEGFAAATSLAEWETAKHKAVRLARGGWRRGHRGQPEEQLQPADLRIVAPPAARQDQALQQALQDDLHDALRDEALYGLDGNDPPAYVADLVAGDETLSPPHRHAEVPTIPLFGRRKVRRSVERRRALAEAAALERAHQSYEEQVIAAIRASADPAASDLSTPDFSTPDLSMAEEAGAEPAAEADG